jgi:hypothetical protein
MNYTMKKIKAISLVLIAFCFSTILFGQPVITASDFNTTMNSQGKIYVVIAVLTVILIGIFIYLIGIDRKLRKLEDKEN